MIQQVFSLVLSVGLWISLVGPLFVPATVLAEVQFKVQTSQTKISLDESVSVKFQIVTDGNSKNIGEPRFKTSDFDEVNSYQSSYVQSLYQNGKFSVQNKREVTKIFRPRKKGSLEIGAISVTVDGQVYQADSIKIQVLEAGAGTPPPKKYGGSVGLRGSRKRKPRAEFFVRAETNQAQVYKGEQVIVSYYIYTNAKVFNLEVTRYPILNGFLKKDLEIPVLGGRLRFQSVTFNGYAYQRALLARYAAYPLKEGSVRIDKMSIKANYHSGNGNGGLLDSSDPFQQFFSQLTPRTATKSSKIVKIQVDPLPVEGRPASFSGGVGDYTVVSAIDQYEVRAHDDVKLTVKVEGKGNVAAIDRPQVKWPEGLELFETKTNLKMGKSGVGEKIFEYLLIPRREGKVTIPVVEFGFFNPDSKRYQTVSTDSIDLNVLTGRPGASQQKGVSPKTTQEAPTPQEQPRYLKKPGELVSSESPLSVGVVILATGTLALLGLIGFVTLDQARRRRGGRAREKQESSRSWEQVQLEESKLQLDSPWREVANVYGAIYDAMIETIDDRYSIGARSYSRAELRTRLVDQEGVEIHVWNRLAKLLEHSESIPYAGAADSSKAGAARAQLKTWIQEGQKLAELLSKGESSS